MSGISKAALTVLLLLGVGLGLAWGRDDSRATTPVRPVAPLFLPSSASDNTGWHVGELRENGLPLIPRGRSDASAVVAHRLSLGDPKGARMKAVAQWDVIVWTTTSEYSWILWERQPGAANQLYKG